MPRQLETFEKKILFLLKKKNFSELNSFEWYKVSGMRLPFEFIKKHYKNISWEKALENIIPEDFLDFLIKEGYLSFPKHFKMLFFHQALSERLIEKYKSVFFTDESVIQAFIMNNPLSDRLIKYFLQQNKCIDTLLSYHHIPENILEEYFLKEILDINEITRKQQLSEDFIKKYKDAVNWILVAENQYFSEKFFDEVLLPSFLKNQKVKNLDYLFNEKLLYNVNFKPSVNFFNKYADYIKFERWINRKLDRKDLLKVSKTVIHDPSELLNLLDSFYDNPAVLKKLFVDTLSLPDKKNKFEEFYSGSYMNVNGDEAFKRLIKTKSAKVLRIFASMPKLHHLLGNIFQEDLKDALSELNLSELKEINDTEKTFLTKVLDLYETYAKILNTDVKDILPVKNIKEINNVDVPSKL